MTDPLVCPYCNKQLKSERGVTQHIFQTPTCRQKQQEAITLASKQKKQQATVTTEPRRSGRIKQQPSSAPIQLRFASGKIPPNLPDQEALDIPFADDDSDHNPLHAKRPAKRPRLDAEAGNEADHSDLASDRDEDDHDSDAQVTNPGVNTSIRDDFRAYCEEHDHHFLSLTKRDETSIKLMHVLKRKAPLNAYESVLKWHLKETGKLKPHESLKDADGYHHRATLMNKLLPRYNLSSLLPKERKRGF